MEEDSRNKSESYGIQFHRQKDTANYISQLVEDSNRWLTRHNLNFVERYIKGEIYIIIKLTVLATNREYDLLFTAIPSGGLETMIPQTRLDSAVKVNKKNTNRCKHPVLISVAHPVECPENIIPSFVWLEPAKERPNLLGEIFAFAHKSSLKVGRINTKGEMGILGVGDTRAFSNNETSLVKSCSEVINGVSSNSSQFIGERIGEFDFVKMVNSIRIGFCNVGIGFCLEESLSLSLKINNVLLSPRPTEACTLELV